MGHSAYNEIKLLLQKNSVSLHLQTFQAINRVLEKVRLFFNELAKQNVLCFSEDDNLLKHME